jgi:hypothetical protein
MNIILDCMFKNKKKPSLKKQYKYIFYFYLFFVWGGGGLEGTLVILSKIISLKSNKKKYFLKKFKSKNLVLS